MLVSVIIPTYNRSELLQRCLRSLVAADVPGLEVIVVDDGGTDDSRSVCAAFPQVTYLWQENAGPATARNLGASRSHGRYLAFIDSDDEWINGGARRLVSQLDANPDVFVAFADSSMGNVEDGFTSFVDTYGGDTFRQLPHDRRADGLRVLTREPFLLQLSTRNVMFLGSMLFRREAFQAIDGFDGDLCGAADWDVFMRLVVAGPVAYSDGPPISRYYKHDAGMSTNSDHMEQDFIRALNSVRRRSSLSTTERTHIEQRIREHVFGWAYHAYEAGDHRLMRARLKQAGELGQAGIRERLFLCATYFPPAFLAQLRRVKHALGI